MWAEQAKGPQLLLICLSLKALHHLCSPPSATEFKTLKVLCPSYGTHKPADSAQVEVTEQSGARQSLPSATCR